MSRTSVNVAMNCKSRKEKVSMFGGARLFRSSLTAWNLQANKLLTP